MRIIKTEIYRFSIPMEPFVIATGTMDYAQNTFVRIFTDTGIYGVGECSAFPMIVGETQGTCLVLARDFAALWRDKNPLDISERMAELDLFIAGNSTIKSAFDMALHDIAAKDAGLPLYKFLGGTKREIVTDITLGIASPAVMAEKARVLKEGGAEALKVKLGKVPADDIQRIREIRKAVGFDIPIRIDANQGWSFEGAVEALTGLEPFKIQFCEQPMRTYNDHLLPELRTQTIVPIMADESVYSHRDADRLCRNDACDYINIKFSKSTGIAESLRIQAIAAEYGVPCMIGGMLESRLALAAKVHFAYAAPNVKFFDLDTCMVGHLEDPIVGGIQYNGYRISISDAPGIGADVEQAFLDTCEKWTI
ncbi:mandelate racemase/muconate lactonizing enzyme family protein [Sphingobacterium psychroaquaticum]|uniref:Dipeptide epimerase n=1 Tax=Sphingobacterium psychroaquaticum TaxID=561061 RepID=A0A1X7K0R1_9SPHI|nr:dipeptide epimerase [Sphingobacterium psychroaquaticum]QBQ42493.1 dipeptide epimerase [Sphingobacterium psychroaquaticum]SMG34501.1 L-alanine-DL-glutamate epimerase [Sphingobacterium psychroaquaticum]